jgi:hypothetical protein
MWSLAEELRSKIRMGEKGKQGEGMKCYVKK